MSKEKDEKWRQIYNVASHAGARAGRELIPTPMIVSEHENMLDDSSPVKNSWYISDGPCGFAWIVVKPGTSSFAKWLKKNDFAHKHYYGGVAIWISEYNQSCAKKTAHAEAMAESLRQSGIRAYAGSRLD